MCLCIRNITFNLEKYRTIPKISYNGHHYFTKLLRNYPHDNNLNFGRTQFIVLDIIFSKLNWLKIGFGNVCQIEILFKTML